MKHIMNKNVIHNGKSYAKGSEILPSDDGFKSIVDAGHANPSGDAQSSEPMQDMGESEGQSESQGKPAKKSKK